jgi:thiol-disulfide isomerase/thioredoxin
VLGDCGPAPAISGITHWLNTPNDAPLALAGMKGKVVLVDFWAYSCINCQRAIKHLDAWYAAYRSAGLDVIGVHTPEYAFEQVTSNVEAGAKRLGITYPIAQDNKYATWNNYGNDSWPADYLIDATGTVRFVSIGEGDYDGTEDLIRQLVMAANPDATLPAATHIADTTPANPNQTEETYLDAQRTNNFAEGDGTLLAGAANFTYPSTVRDDEFALAGAWSVGDESLTAKAGAGIRLHYDAADIYLDVGGTGSIRATVDGRTTTYPVSGAPNIYQLLHRSSPGDGLLDVTLSPGLEVYSFTFG